MKDNNPFEEARDIIERRGWAIGRFEDRWTGQVCLVGGLRKATGHHARTVPFWDLKYRRAVRMLGRVNQQPRMAPLALISHNLQNWNDTRSTHTSVENLLDRAAAEWERDQERRRNKWWRRAARTLISPAPATCRMVDTEFAMVLPVIDWPVVHEPSAEERARVTPEATRV